jgi:hypothetical protein
MPVQLTTDAMLVISDIALDTIKQLLDGRDVDTGVAALEQMPHEHAGQADLHPDQKLDEISLGH